ncbi:hypothetical protein RHMOL_Rhmol09G0095600 [Rhododendron molle]|uniref:Uncharacterized protein n=1 Tax=Rhododendron molle TaxID=49168 RepID=A0ACC0MBK5_RHOML|nr:hypothetical protein RHMOL_Rhmol09G0095600 [Rhododendron molle]
MVRLWFIFPLPVRLSGRIWGVYRFWGSGTEIPISAPNPPNAIPTGPCPSLEGSIAFYTCIKAGFGLKRVPRTRVKVYLPLLSVHPVMVQTVGMTRHGRGLLSIPGFPITGKPGRIAETQQQG